MLNHNVVAVVNVFPRGDDLASSGCKYWIILMCTEINTRMITRYFGKRIGTVAKRGGNHFRGCWPQRWRNAHQLLFVRHFLLRFGQIGLELLNLTVKGCKRSKCFLSELKNELLGNRIRAAAYTC